MLPHSTPYSCVLHGKLQHGDVTCDALPVRAAALAPAGLAALDKASQAAQRGLEEAQARVQVCHWSLSAAHQLQLGPGLELPLLLLVLLGLQAAQAAVEESQAAEELLQQGLRQVRGQVAQGFCALEAP